VKGKVNAKKGPQDFKDLYGEALLGGNDANSDEKYEQKYIQPVKLF
jgi:hypothetical protein